MKNRILCISQFLFITFISANAQEMKTPFTDWVKSEFPTSHKSIEALIATKYGTDDLNQNKYMIELQCNSFNNVLVFMNAEDASWEILEKALVYGCTYTGSDRTTMDWWEWPQTDWTKVEYEYKLLLDAKSADNRDQ